MAVDSDVVKRTSSWRQLLMWSAVGTIVVIVLVTVLSREVIPPLLIAAVLLAGGLWWLRRAGKGPVIFLLVVSALLFLTNLPFAIPAFAHPSSALEFILIGAMTVTLLLSIVAAVAALRSRRPAGSTPRLLGMAGVGVVAVLAVIGVVAAVTTENDTASSGDLTLAAKSVEWTTDSLTAKAGEIGVFVDNQDTARHDFKIEDVVLADLPASKKTRVTFSAPAGTYEFICSIHPEMKGTLTVT